MNRSVVLLNVLLLTNVATNLNFALAEDSVGKKVLATYSGQEMTFEQFAEQQPALASWIGISANEDQIQSSLESMIFNSLMAEDAEATGLEQDPDVRAEIKKLLTSAYLKKRIPRGKISIEASEIEAAYQKNLEKYKSEDLIKISHILVNTQAEVEQLAKQLSAGAKWDVLVAKNSRDPLTAKRGGSFGLIPPSQLMAELRDASKNLPIGEISKPVKSPFGFHLLRVDERPAPTYKPLEEVKKEVYTELFRAKETELSKDLKDELFKKYSVVINQEEIQQIIQAKTAENVNVARASLGAQKRKPGDPSELQTLSVALNFGKIPAKKITDSFIFKNTTEKTLTIGKVASTCKCIDASVDKNILTAGQIAKLTFTYNPDMFQEKGPIQKMIYLESSDSLDSRKILRLVGEIIRK